MPGDIIILHLCTKHLDDMIYSLWDIEHDRLQLAILGHFFIFFSLKPEKSNFEKLKKMVGDMLLQMCTINENHLCMLPEIWSATVLLFYTCVP